MKKLLHIISSARGNQSYSKGLSSAIVQQLKDQRLVDSVVERDLSKDAPTFLDTETVHEFYKMPSDDDASRRLLQYTSSLLEEVTAADILVIGTPVHNLGIAAPLKAWLDHLVRVGVTYGYNENGKTFLLAPKKIYLAIASGGPVDRTNPENEFVDTYFRAVFDAYLGFSDVTTFRIGNTVAPGFVPDYASILQTL